MRHDHLAARGNADSFRQRAGDVIVGKPVETVAPQALLPAGIRQRQHLLHLRQRAVEAGIEGIPAIGFSLLDFSWHADFEPSKPYIKKIALEVLEKGLPDGVVLNVNLPKSEIKGAKVCRQAKAVWEERFDKRTNPQGKEYYWLTGEFVNLDKGEDTDEWALKNGYISIVPIQFDLTAHHAIQQLNTWDLT